MTRRSLWFTAPRRLEVREEPLRPLASDEVRVETIASGPSAGTELLVYRGEAPAELPADATLPSLGGSLAFPLRYGYAAVGRVIERGAEVDGLRDGDLVFAFHPHADRFTARADDLVVLPDGLSPQAAVLLPSAETAVNLVLDGRPAVGERVAVFGQGVVGLLVTALLARFPLAALVTVDPLDARRRLSRELGAGASVDPGVGEAREADDALRRALGGGSGPVGPEGPEDAGGADLSYELSGDPAVLDRAIAATGFAGRVVIGSWYGTKRAPVDLGGYYHRSRIALATSQVSTLAPELTGRWTKRRRLAVALGLLARVRPERLISHRVPFARAAELYRLLDERPDETLQTVLTYD